MNDAGQRQFHCGRTRTDEDPWPGSLSESQRFLVFFSMSPSLYQGWRSLTMVVGGFEKLGNINSDLAPNTTKGSCLNDRILFANTSKSHCSLNPRRSSSVSMPPQLVTQCAHLLPPCVFSFNQSNDYDSRMCHL